MISYGSVIFFPGVSASMSVGTQNFIFVRHPEGTEHECQWVSESVSGSNELYILDTDKWTRMYVYIAT